MALKRTQVLLTPEQKIFLDEKSLNEGLSVSELVRKYINTGSKKDELHDLRVKKALALKGAWVGSKWNDIDESEWQRIMRQEK